MKATEPRVTEYVECPVCRRQFGRVDDHMGQCARCGWFPEKARP